MTKYKNNVSMKTLILKNEILMKIYWRRKAKYVMTK